jgi:hypothetical protein
VQARRYDAQALVVKPLPRYRLPNHFMQESNAAGNIGAACGVDCSHYATQKEKLWSGADFQTQIDSRVIVSLRNCDVT